VVIPHSVPGWNSRGRSTKSWQPLVLCRRFTIFGGSDGSAVQVESFGKQRTITQPDSVSSAEFAAKRGYLHLELAVIVPLPLESRAARHLELAEQPALFIPLPANPVEQAVWVRFFGGESPVLVPGSVQTMPAPVSQTKCFAKHSASVIVSLDRGFQHTFTASDRPLQRPVWFFIRHAIARHNQRFQHNEGMIATRQAEANLVSRSVQGLPESDPRQFTAMKT
jgi:hypothetical protein